MEAIEVKKLIERFEKSKLTPHNFLANYMRYRNMIYKDRNKQALIYQLIIASIFVSEFTDMLFVYILSNFLMSMIIICFVTLITPLMEKDLFRNYMKHHPRIWYDKISFEGYNILTNFTFCKSHNNHFGMRDYIVIKKLTNDVFRGVIIVNDKSFEVIKMDQQ